VATPGRGHARGLNGCGVTDSPAAGDEEAFLRSPTPQPPVGHSPASSSLGATDDGLTSVSAGPLSSPSFSWSSTPVSSAPATPTAPPSVGATSSRRSMGASTPPGGPSPSPSSATSTLRDAAGEVSPSSSVAPVASGDSVRSPSPPRTAPLPVFFFPGYYSGSGASLSPPLRCPCGDASLVLGCWTRERGLSSRAVHFPRDVPTTSRF